MEIAFILVDKLIEYTNIFYMIFPVKFVSNLEKDIVIERIDYCTNNNVLYDHRLFYLNVLQNMSDSLLITIVPLMINSLNCIGYDY